MISKTGRDPQLYSLHSFRRGGCTWAFKAGVPTDLSQHHGDWSSDCYKIYLAFDFKEKLSVSEAMARKSLTSFPHFFLSEASEVKVQIISDSIAKCVEGIQHAEVQAFPSININQLAYKNNKGHLVLDKPIAIFQVGTNNIETMESGAILSAFNNLNTSIRQKS